MNEDVMMHVRYALSTPKEPPEEIVFCGECPDLAIGRVDGAPLCLACMLARLGEAEEKRASAC
jgi:hypothetical protein